MFCSIKGPRWASWNLGVFLCIRCAGIHRNLGVHISKVKSVNLDSWTPEQVVSLQQMGNSRARAVYEANLPDNFRRPQNDSSLESFVRAKYEHKKYIAREWVPPQLPKVNWEKEIDEEIEKQKRRKKTVVEKKTLTNVEVPQLPKPKNPSPKPGRVQTQIAAVNSTTNANNTNSQTDNKNTDLLGLQNGEDFSGFLSAPTATTTKEETKKDDDTIKSEEESFFNQTVPTEKEKVKLTKDSIMALYGSTPVNFNQFQAPANYAPVGGFPQQNFPQQNLLAQQNGIAPQFAPVVPQYQQQFQRFPQYQWGSMPQNMHAMSSTNTQYYQNGPSSMPTTTQSPSNMQLPQMSSFVGNQQQQQQQQQFPTGQFGIGQTIPNPFYGAQPNSLPQQFGNLTLNQTSTPNPGPTISSNIWN